MFFENDPKVCCIKGCDSPSIALGLCNRHWRRNKKYGSPAATMLHPASYRGMTAIDRFNSRVDKSGACWMWKGAKGKNGYGSFFGSVGDVAFQKAHRFSYAYFNGPIGKDMNVCHKCDNPSCVNPEHLFLGTTQDNIDDKLAKGRSRIQRGEDAPRAKLTEAQVREIMLDPRPHTVLSHEYGVTRHTISDIKRKYSWQHIDLDPVKSPRDNAGYLGKSDNITEEIVRIIRASTDRAEALAEQYGVTTWTIYDIRKRRSWKHVA